MNEQQFGNKVRHLLNQGSTLDDAASRSLREKLRAARQLALARQRPEPVRALAWADNILGSPDGRGSRSLRILAPIVALALSVAVVYSWQMDQRIAEVEEIDALLLTDDLPIDAYLDRNFQNWLKKRISEQ